MEEDIEKIIKYSQSLKLLYVEDNVDARESTQMVLEEFFDNIVVASDGEDGYTQFQENDIEIIITDINMPKLNGLAMIKKIRELDKEIPILVLSAYNESGFFMDSIKVGVEGYLLKPIDLDQFVGVLNKVVEKLKLKEEIQTNLHFLKEYQDATNESSIVSKTDRDGMISYVNEQFCKISGYTKEELIGKSHHIIKDPNTHSEIYEALWDTIKNKKQIWNGILKNIAKDSHSYYVKSIIKPIVDRDGNIVEYIALSTDITNIMSPQKQLEDLVNSVGEAIVVLVQIEDFDDIHKYYGKDLVNKLENKFATQIYDLMPKECEFEKVYPLGEGRYAFAKDKLDCKSNEAIILQQLKFFQETTNNTSLKIDDFEYDISIVISFAFGVEALENAMYGLTKLLVTKQDFIVANNLVEQEQLEASKHLKTLKMVKDAIQNYNIVSYFQPIVDNKTRQIVKYESLVRLIDKDKNIISPFFFLDVAKKGKYYPQITSIVLNNSFEVLNHTNMDVSINISALDIEKKATREKIIGLLEINKAKAQRIVFEILEDEEAKDFALIKSFITQIKKFGVKIAIDDFGSGYSSFERILDYQPDILKIDGSLIKNIITDDFSLSVVKTMVLFAQEQNMQVVAEYVENEEIFNVLCTLGVDYSQGYYFGKPAPLNFEL